MLFYRSLRVNLREPACQWLSDSLAECLGQTDAEFAGGVVGLSRLPTRFVEVPLDRSGNEDLRIGWILMVSFWAFGDSDDEVFGNLDRLFDNLATAIQEISDQVKAHMMSG
jgi:hypothetical protein